MLRIFGIRATSCALAFAATVSLQGCDRQQPQAENPAYADTIALISDSSDGQSVTISPLGAQTSSTPEGFVTDATLSEVDAANRYAAFVTYLNGLHPGGAIEPIRAELAREAAQASALARNADTARQNGNTALFAGFVGGLMFCDSHDSSPSPLCQLSGKGAEAGIDQKFSESDYRGAFFKLHDGMLATMSGVETVLDALGRDNPDARISVAFHECCLRGFDTDKAYDLIEFRNMSDAALTDAIMRVRMIGANGETTDVWHPVPSMPPGGGFYAAYLGAGDMRPAQYPPSVKSIEISLWSPHTKPATFTYTYAGDEREADIKAFVDTLHAGVGQYYGSEAWFGRGISLNMSKTIPAPFKLFITFSNGTQTKTVTWHEDHWTITGGWDYQDQQFDFDPSKIDVAIQFDGSQQVYAIGSATR